MHNWETPHSRGKGDNPAELEQGGIPAHRSENRALGLSFPFYCTYSTPSHCQWPLLGFFPGPSGERSRQLHLLEKTAGTPPQPQEMTCFGGVLRSWASWHIAFCRQQSMPPNLPPQIS